MKTMAKPNEIKDISIANPDAVVAAKQVRFTVLADRLIRMEYSKDGILEDRRSKVFWYRNQPVPAFRTANTENNVESVYVQNPENDIL